MYSHFEFSIELSRFIQYFSEMRFVLPVIVISQFFCTSLWFAGNAIIENIVGDRSTNVDFLGDLTSAIQFGFISGTLVFAILTIADRFSPSRVFFFSALIAAIFNLGITLADLPSGQLLLLRFMTGFFLAGIYPVGMKIASDHYQAGLGKSLGFLVGALVLGTALPHLLKTVLQNLPWRYIVYSTSALSIIGGLAMVIFVKDGMHRKAAQKIKFTSFLAGFKNPEFRSVAFGYFGHMWELYTFWAFVPVMLSFYNDQHSNSSLNIPLFSFLIIGCGSLACVAGGFLSQTFGEKKVATLALLSSGICCLLSPFLLAVDSSAVLIAFLLFWGLVVIADSPLFSTLVARHAPIESRGSALTIVNCIGFAITIISIQFLSVMKTVMNIQNSFILLVIGPVVGLIALLKK